MARDRPGHLPPLRPHRRRAVRHRAGQRHLGGADVDGRVPSLELPPRRRRAPRRVADRPRPDARLPVRPRAPRRPHRPRGPRRDRRRRLAEDLRRPRDPHLRPDRARARLRRRAPRRAGLRPRGGAPRPGRRHHDLVAQGPRARQGVRRLQPERPRPHHRLAYSVRGRSRARCRRRSPGTRSTTSSPRTSRSPPCPTASPSSATCTPGSTTPCSRSSRCWSGPSATSAPARRPRPSPTTTT